MAITTTRRVSARRGRVGQAAVLLSILVLWSMPMAGRSAPFTEFATYDMTHLADVSSSDPLVRRRAWDEVHFVSALQGIVNRAVPRLYVFWVGRKGATDRFWLERMSARGEWLRGIDAVEMRGLGDLVARFHRYARGLVVWDERVPATSNVASTIAGVSSLLPVRYDTTSGSLFLWLTEEMGMPVVERLINEDGTPMFTGKGTIPGTNRGTSHSPKCDAYMWAAENYLAQGRANPAKLGYYPDAYWLTGMPDVPARATLLSNHDYFIAHQGFFFDVSPWGDERPDDDPKQPLGADLRTLRTIMQTAHDATDGNTMIHVGGFTPWDQKYTSYTGGGHDGVPTEWRFVEILSCYNAYIDADAPGLHAMANASFFQHYPLEKSYPQENLPTEKQLRKRGLLDNDGRVTSRTYVSIYVGDYDSAAWLYQSMPKLWEDEARGEIPLGWAFNPNLADRFPVGMAYARKTATDNDTFVAGDCGAGYLNPGHLAEPRKYSRLPSAVDAWERHCAKYYRQWDLRLTGFIIDGDAPRMTSETLQAYARFSPQGCVTYRDPREGIVDGMPWLPMSEDLTGDEKESAQVMARSAPPPTGFAIFRTILWPPKKHKRLFEEVRRLRPDIEIVEPHTLMFLLKRHLGTHNQGVQGDDRIPE